MSGRVRWAVVVVLAIVAAGQAMPVTRNNPSPAGPPVAPPDVHAILVRACYDCHSNETRWPWYSRVAPASWLIARDVQEGRRELNLSVWDQYPDRRRARKLKEIVEQVDRGKMPQWYYLLLHSDARLSTAERERLVDWAKRP